MGQLERKVVLSPERSLAIDLCFFLMAPIFLDIGHPDGSDSSIRSLVVAQDTGGAIKGLCVVIYSGVWRSCRSDGWSHEV